MRPYLLAFLSLTLLIAPGAASAGDALLQIENRLDRSVGVSVDPEARRVHLFERANDLTPTEIASDQGVSWQVPAGQYVVAWVGSDRGFSINLDEGTLTDLRLLFGGPAGEDVLIAQINDGKLAASGTIRQGPLPPQETEGEDLATAPAEPTWADDGLGQLEIVNDSGMDLQVGFDRNRRTVYVHTNPSSYVTEVLQPGEALQMRVAPATYSVRWVDRASSMYAAVSAAGETSVRLQTVTPAGMTVVRLQAEVREDGVLQRSATLATLPQSSHRIVDLRTDDVWPGDTTVIRRDSFGNSSVTIVRRSTVRYPVVVRTPRVVHSPVVVHKPHYRSSLPAFPRTSNIVPLSTRSPFTPSPFSRWIRDQRQARPVVVQPDVPGHPPVLLTPDGRAVALPEDGCNRCDYRDGHGGQHRHHGSRADDGRKSGLQVTVRVK